ncbi:hypothetical protein C9374_005730 [Naegleria lovaniensis]|uniref:RRM domain-containing protein n=1 Tax=Naegleria lovaniensis TaxID=51637 RepID=A0AA88GP06_NAELO|nr:uncharacterized protein C9374_005730 [Naegleria lovaniensis]KAG2381938.1 hypothetical protein C9374_005730 [Naegleria lovaniensis]
MSTSQPPAIKSTSASSLNDLQSRLAKLQQNISQKLSKTSAAIPTPASSLDHGTPQQTPVSSSSLTLPSQAKIQKPSTISSTGEPVKSTLPKIQKPHSMQSGGLSTTAQHVATQVVKQASSVIGGGSPPPKIGQTKSSTKIINKPATVSSTVISAGPQTNVNSNTSNEPTLEQQIYLQDYQKQKQTSQLQQEYQQQLKDYEQSQLQQNEQANKKKKKKLRTVYTASGKSDVWEDPNLEEFEENDFRIYANNLGNEVTDQMLEKFFSHYPSFSKAMVIRDKRTNRTKGYGFISFLDCNDYVHALENLNGKYLGNRPLVLKPSKWKDRALK